MELSDLISLFSRNGCSEFFCKHLAPNDNSKNQVYLAGDFSPLNILPLGRIFRDDSQIPGSERDRFKAELNLSWISNDLNLSKAPNTNLILYPKYPEVRLSGFLRGARQGPWNRFMTVRDPERILVLAPASDQRVLAWVGSIRSGVGAEISSVLERGNYSLAGAFHRVPVTRSEDGNLSEVLRKLAGIHNSGWIDSKRMGANREILPCEAQNCGGFTLEAELGIQQNSEAEPDYLGWEIKQFAARSFDNPVGGAITLMTPEPTDTEGYYKRCGVEKFVRKYGYYDMRGRPDRMNFGGLHRVGNRHPRTGLKMILCGFDPIENKIDRTDGTIQLVSNTGEVAASWGFAPLLEHWNRKHAQAIYVPSKKHPDKPTRYEYGHKVMACVGTSFPLFLGALADSKVYYDPGIKIEKISGPKPRIHRRSQFRIRQKDIRCLYNDSKWYNVKGPE